MASRPPNLPPPPQEVTPVVSQPGVTAVASNAHFRIPTDTRPVPDDNRPDPTVSTVDDFLFVARQRWRTISDAENVYRRDAKDDLDFFASDQWPDHIRQEREKAGKPCLTINRLPSFARMVTNDMRDGRPGIEVVPVDSGADPAKAEVRQGIIQHIEANSDADVAYSRAANGQVRMGRGYFRILPEYADDESFEQELRIRSIRNPATVYFDVASQELDGSDGRYAFIVEDVPRDEFERRYGSESLASFELLKRTGERSDDWMPTGKIRVAEYFYFEPKKKTIVLLSDGKVLDAELADHPDVVAALAQTGVSVTPRRREVDGKQLYWALINGVSILEGNEDKTGGRPMPGKWLPIIPVYGEEIDLDGRIDYRGIIRDAKDAQRELNFWKSTKTETVSLAPKVPWVAEEGQIEGYEDLWRDANIKNFSVLKYKAKSLDGHLVGPPQRNVSEPPIQAMALLSAEAENDVRSTAGFLYDINAQEARREQSGKAILARQRQGEVGNSHFAANMAISLRHAGRILLDLIPHYYSTPRIQRILGRDGQQKTILTHAGSPEAAQLLAQEQQMAEQSIYDLSVGRYDVRVVAGVSYLSQRQQDQETMGHIMQTNPAMANLLGDLFFGTMDTPIAKRAAKRMHAALPPPLQDDSEDGKPQIPPQLRAQMEQAQQVIDELTKQLNAATEELTIKAHELASKERIAQIQANTQIAVAQSKAESTGAIALLAQQQKMIEQLVAIDLARLQAMTPSGEPASATPATQSPQPAAAVPPLAPDAGMPPMGMSPDGMGAPAPAEPGFGAYPQADAGPSGEMSPFQGV